MDFTEIKTLLDQQGDAITSFRKQIDMRLDKETKEREALEARMNRTTVPNGGGGDECELKEIGEAFRLYIKSGDASEIKSMSTGSDPEGGYTVYPSLSSEMTKRIFETSPMRQLARVVQIGTDSFEELLDLYEPDAAWVGEKEARPETATPDLGRLHIPAHEIYANPKVTQKLLDDSSIDIGSWLVDKMSGKFLRLETTAFYSGNGIKKPRGFLTYPTEATDDASRDWARLQHVVTGAANGFAAPTTSASPADCLIDLQTSLKAEYRANAWWQMNKKTAGAVRKFKDSDGRFIWQDSIQQGQPSMLLGHPVALAEDMPDVAAGNLPVAFGDFKAGYTIVDRKGERLLRDPYTSKPNVHFYMYRRVGGDVNNFEAIKVLKVAAS